MDRNGRKLLALDIGRVCLALKPERAFAGLGVASNQAVPADLQRIIYAYSCGRLDSAQFAAALGEYLGGRYTATQLEEIWKSYLVGEITVTTWLLEQLWARDWHLVFFSDTQPWHNERLRELLSYSARIPEGVYSFEVGAEKPSDLMYETFESRFGKPDLYLDDLPQNIAGGFRHGWNAVRYIGAEATRETCEAILARV